MIDIGYHESDDQSKTTGQAVAQIHFMTNQLTSDGMTHCETLHDAFQNSSSVSIISAISHLELPTNFVANGGCLHAWMRVMKVWGN